MRGEKFQSFSLNHIEILTFKYMQFNFFFFEISINKIQKLCPERNKIKF